MPVDLQERLRRFDLCAFGQDPPDVQPGPSEFFDEVVGGQRHGEDEHIGDESGALRGLQRIDAPRRGEVVAGSSVPAAVADALSGQPGTAQQRCVLRFKLSCGFPDAQPAVSKAEGEPPRLRQGSPVAWI